MYKRQIVLRYDIDGGKDLMSGKPYPVVEHPDDDPLCRITEVVQCGYIDLRDLIVTCLLYTSDAADERSSVDLGGRRIIKKKKQRNQS